MKKQPKFKKGDLVQYKEPVLFEIRGFGIITSAHRLHNAAHWRWYNIHWQNNTDSKGYAYEQDIRPATRENHVV